MRIQFPQDKVSAGLCFLHLLHGFKFLPVGNVKEKWACLGIFRGEKALMEIVEIHPLNKQQGLAREELNRCFRQVAGEGQNVYSGSYNE